MCLGTSLIYIIFMIFVYYIRRIFERNSRIILSAEETHHPAIREYICALHRDMMCTGDNGNVV